MKMLFLQKMSSSGNPFLESANDRIAIHHRNLQFPVAELEKTRICLSSSLIKQICVEN